MIKKKAFTLAEVLTTLLLIGIVAAFTIPVFMTEFQKNKWTITFKRTFAETFNALGRVALDEDCAKSLTCTHIFEGSQSDSTDELGDALIKTLATSRVCRRNEDGCFSHPVRIGLNSGETQSLKDTMGGDVNFASDKPFYSFITQRGVSYAVFSFGTQCLNDTTQAALNEQYINYYVLHPEQDGNQILSLCGFIIMDVNGSQKPNVWGRDVFGVWLTDRSVLGVYPFGGDNDARFNIDGNYKTDNVDDEGNQIIKAGSSHCGTQAGQDTRGCAARIIKDGWVMKY